MYCPQVCVAFTYVNIIVRITVRGTYGQVKVGTCQPANRPSRSTSTFHYRAYHPRHASIPPTQAMTASMALYLLYLTFRFLQKLSPAEANMTKTISPRYLLHHHLLWHIRINYTTCTRITHSQPHIGPDATTSGTRIPRDFTSELSICPALYLNRFCLL